MITNSLRTCFSSFKLVKLNSLSAKHNSFNVLCCRPKFSKPSEWKKNVLIRRKQEAAQSPRSLFLKPTVFTVAIFTSSFTGAAVWQYENMRKRARQIISAPKRWATQKFDPSRSWLQDKFNRNITAKPGPFRQFCISFWNSLTEGQKIFCSILYVNLLVYVCWKVPAFKGTMVKFFTSCPTSKNICLPMLLSNYSHKGVFHLAANMYVLCSFSSSLVESLGKEQFLAFYISAGVTASFGSLMYRILTKKPSFSLGASGAVMGVISYICFKYPDAQLAIIFLPFLTFKAITGITTLMAVDLAFLCTKFQIFDHAAHLSGALFGVFWYYYGNQYIWQKRGPLLEWWHKQRNR